jgi:hypothetical protein
LAEPVLLWTLVAGWVHRSRQRFHSQRDELTSEELPTSVNKGSCLQVDPLPDYHSPWAWLAGIFRKVIIAGHQTLSGQVFPLGRRCCSSSCGTSRTTLWTIGHDLRRGVPRRYHPVSFDIYTTVVGLRCLTWEYSDQQTPQLKAQDVALDSRKLASNKGHAACSEHLRSLAGAHGTFQGSSHASSPNRLPKSLVIRIRTERCC